MPSQQISILMVEDNPGDARLVQELLLESSWAGRFAVTWVDRLGLAFDKVANNSFQVVLLDLSLPDSHGLDTLTRMRAKAPSLPIVVLTGLDDEDLALRAMQGGAQDYLVKGRGDGDLIRRAIRYSIERHRAEEALRQSQARFQAIYENTSLGISTIDPGSRLIDANPAVCAILGYSQEELRGTSILDITHPDDRDGTQSMMAGLMRGQYGHYTLEKRFQKRTGEIIWGRVNVSLVRGIEGEPLFSVALIEDITNRREMEDRLRLAAQVLENTSEGIFVTNAEREIILVNPAFTDLTGFDSAEVVGHKPSILSSGRHDAAFYERINATLVEVGKWQGEIWNRRKSGELFAEWLNISVVRNQNDDITNYVAVFSDITSRKQTEERLNYQANHDPLTTLPNRTLFYERLSRALARAHRNRLTVGLLFLDLDHFKEVNDSCGHLIGDMLLQTVAERLTGCTRQGDTVARLAGDEFTIILEDIADFRDAAVVAQKILRQLAEPFHLNGYRLHVTTSIGISLYPADGEDIQTLLRNADAAMYRAKKQGKNNYQFHSESLNAQAFERLALESSLLHAVERQQFRLHYQPVYDLASGQVVAVEALLRWQHPEVGVVLPAQFLSLAEETGLISPIGRWVLNEACRQMAAWHAAGLGTLRVNVNLSGQQLLQFDLTDCVSAALRDSQLPPEFLELELPESSVMGKDHENGRVLNALKALGVRIAIDDFGTGYSSFGYLRRLPIDTLKIDQSFVRDIMTDADDAKIITAITAIAHSLRLNVVAEGVETTEQLAFLKKHQCDQAQGFLFQRPLPPAELTQLLQQRAEAVAG
jgi:diguanylate cyclase (GGDEF)-like protein/PAS domain S-box-containing protein